MPRLPSPQAAQTCTVAQLTLAVVCAHGERGTNTLRPRSRGRGVGVRFSVRGLGLLFALVSARRTVQLLRLCDRLRVFRWCLRLTLSFFLFFSL